MIGPEVDEAWFDSYLKNRAHTVRGVVAEDDEVERALGLVTLADIDWVSRSCIFHIMVGPAHQGAIVGTFGASEMHWHAFRDLNLRRVELGVLASNRRAIAMYESLGFVREGTKRAAEYKGGEYVDLHMMALLRDEWEAMQP